MSETPPDPAETIDLRVPLWNVSALVLLAAALAALNLFLPLGILSRAVTVLGACASLITAFVAYRMYLVADADGIGLRATRHSYSVAWSELADVGVVEHKIKTMYLQLMLADGSLIDIPASLTSPSRPVARPIAYRRLQTLGRRILDYPETHEVTT